MNEGGRLHESADDGFCGQVPDGEVLVVEVDRVVCGLRGHLREVVHLEA
eukprot:CAMPEP_0206259106 /NCGR_PEP_ID=MMETSP0047_2-20121206/26294_1 /ASSEMBLY_ACC=CAM_ASM_000192 /TAXON_ID=195065 /ORGANISM="Chroomonas mesostigmatica_cf, Strain CCMP1168" /LENGTH=48 /DNA_ID= /DNA_START= /DNA_END= /DNA_ORIENTATION=